MVDEVSGLWFFFCCTWWLGVGRLGMAQDDRLLRMRFLSTSPESLKELSNRGVAVVVTSIQNVTLRASGLKEESVASTDTCLVPGVLNSQGRLFG